MLSIKLISQLCSVIKTTFCFDQKKMDHNWWLRQKRLSIESTLTANSCNNFLWIDFNSDNVCYRWKLLNFCFYSHFNWNQVLHLCTTFCFILFKVFNLMFVCCLFLCLFVVFFFVFLVYFVWPCHLPPAWVLFHNVCPHI